VVRRSITEVEGSEFPPGERRLNLGGNGYEASFDVN
jgi:hypothetical protein